MPVWSVRNGELFEAEDRDALARLVGADDAAAAEEIETETAEGAETDTVPDAAETEAGNDEGNDGTEPATDGTDGTDAGEGSSEDA